MITDSLGGSILGRNTGLDTGKEQRTVCSNWHLQAAAGWGWSPFHVAIQLLAACIMQGQVLEESGPKNCRFYCLQLPYLKPLAVSSSSFCWGLSGCELDPLVERLSLYAPFPWLETCLRGHMAVLSSVMGAMQRLVPHGGPPAYHSLLPKHTGWWWVPCLMGGYPVPRSMPASILLCCNKKYKCTPEKDLSLVVTTSCLKGISTYRQTWNNDPSWKAYGVAASVAKKSYFSVTDMGFSSWPA